MYFSVFDICDILSHEWNVIQLALLFISHTDILILCHWLKCEIALYLDL